MNKPHFHFVTLFPETVDVWMRSSIIGRAQAAGLFDFSTYQLRDYTTNKHRSVDDAAYGGGGGMVLKIEPLVTVTEQIWEKYSRENCHVVYFSPGGTLLNHSLVDRYSQTIKAQHIVLICGHYEGIDQRFVDGWVDEEVSLGNFVVSGGELPALAFTDALIRHIDGTISHDSGAKSESFHLKDGDNPLIEYPHYTRPPEFRGLKVPDVLLSGDHERVAAWRSETANIRTKFFNERRIREVPECP